MEFWKDDFRCYSTINGFKYFLKEHSFSMHFRFQDILLLYNVTYVHFIIEEIPRENTGA